MCFQLVERFSLCRCFSQRHAVDPCRTVGRHAPTEKVILVGALCERCSAEVEKARQRTAERTHEEQAAEEMEQLASEFMVARNLEQGVNLGQLNRNQNRHRQVGPKHEVALKASNAYKSGMEPRRWAGRGAVLTVAQLRAMTMWIRDTLEPFIAQHGPEPLSPDTVLELAAFFSQLLAETSRVVPTMRMFPGLVASNAATRPLITLDDIRVSRIHRALLTISGRGTRWPRKLIEICDTLIAAWNGHFGDLNVIRPLLYEKGGRLYEVRAEKKMSRHALLVKWLSDRTSLVSPLRALESGHLEFRPGQWWIHAIFAFYDGIIDSPDPHGGITADADGAYAITLTGNDEIESASPEVFTYRVRKDDRGLHRLLQAFLPLKQSIRVMRSHTLRSMWSPAVGIRYDGLYKISSYSVWAEKDKAVRFDVQMQREADQVSMREVQKHPTSEEVDDYLEYKRLRLIRLNKGPDPIKRAPKAEQVLGVLPTMHDANAELDQEQEARPKLRRGAAYFTGSQGQFIESPGARTVTPDGTESPKYAIESLRQPRATSLDGTTLAAVCSNPDAHVSTRQWRQRYRRSPRGDHEDPTASAPIRQCCTDYDDEQNSQKDLPLVANFDRDLGLPKKQGGVLVFYFEGNLKVDPMLVLDHAMLRTLKQNLSILGEITRNRGFISSAFWGDLKGISGIVTEWKRDSVSRDGHVDRCLRDVAEAMGDLDGYLEIV